MAGSDWVSQHIQLKTGVVEIIYDGIPLKLTPIETRVLAHLLETGSITYREVYPKNPGGATGKVYMSNLRSALADQGFPFTISKVVNRPNNDGRYYLVNAATLGGRLAENGGEDGGINSASPSADRLQDLGRGTTK